MSGSLLLGSGWHPFLFREEISALFGDFEVLHPRLVLLDKSIDEKLLSRLSRAALVDDLLHFGGYSDVSDFDIISEKISNWSKENLPSGSFAVRSKKLGSGIEGVSRRELEKEVVLNYFLRKTPSIFKTLNMR